MRAGRRRRHAPALHGPRDDARQEHGAPGLKAGELDLRREGAGSGPSRAQGGQEPRQAGDAAHRGLRAREEDEDGTRAPDEPVRHARIHRAGGSQRRDVHAGGGHVGGGRDFVRDSVRRAPVRPPGPKELVQADRRGEVPRAQRASERGVRRPPGPAAVRGQGAAAHRVGGAAAPLPRVAARAEPRRRGGVRSRSRERERNNGGASGHRSGGLRPRTSGNGARVNRTPIGWRRALAALVPRAVGETGELSRRALGARRGFALRDGPRDAFRARGRFAHQGGRRRRGGVLDQEGAGRRGDACGRRDRHGRDARRGRVRGRDGRGRRRRGGEGHRGRGRLRVQPRRQARDDARFGV